MMKEVALINDVGAWAEKNFGELRAPELGIVEEIGEAAHAELKHYQRIRGFDKLETFQDAFTDSLGDAMIFLCDWCHIHNAYFQFSQIKMVGGKNWAVEGFPSIMQHLLQATSALFSPTVGLGDVAFASQVANRITQGLSYWACKYDFDLPLIVSATWVSVSGRDWKSNPIEGNAKD